MKGKKNKYKGFTLIEMLVVLLVIAILILLFVPSLAGQKNAIEAKGDAAIVKVVETQVELYQMNEGGKPKWSDLKDKKYLTAEQIEKAKKANVKLDE